MNGGSLGDGTSAGPSTTAQAAVFVPSVNIADEAIKIRGPDFNEAHTLDALLQSYATIGFQASGLTRAIEIVEKMVSRDVFLEHSCSPRAIAEFALKTSAATFGCHPTRTICSRASALSGNATLLEEVEAV